MLEDLPISLKHILPIVDRVHSRYPTISKIEVILIIKSLLEVIRELLVLGKIVSINDLFDHAHVIFYIIERRNGKSFPSVKIRVQTPRDMR
jgi:predicted rRNA methylase YqxC with S4 and FtsJ domains